MCAINRLSSHVAAPSVPEFQGIKHLIQYLDGCLQCPIMYPYGLARTTTHELHQQLYPGDFHSQKIYNGLVAFSDGGEGRNPNKKCTIACVILCLFGISVHWPEKINQPLHPI